MGVNQNSSSRMERVQTKLKRVTVVMKEQDTRNTRQWDHQRQKNHVAKRKSRPHAKQSRMKKVNQNASSRMERVQTKLKRVTVVMKEQDTRNTRQWDHQRQNHVAKRKASSVEMLEMTRPHAKQSTMKKVNQNVSTRKAKMDIT